MQIVAIIPVHNYVDNLFNIITWINNYYSLHFESYKIIVVNDNSDKKHGSVFNKVSMINNVMLINSPSDRVSDLRYSLSTVNSYNPDMVHIIESDAVPNDKVFTQMLNAYNKLQNVASISPMYVWKNKYCYPTHAHWHTDKKSVVEGIGNVSKVGKAGVPFLFSLWNGQLFKEIDNSKFGKFIHLDRDFGGYVHSKGYEHYRLVDCNIEHSNSGKNSW